MPDRKHYYDETDDIREYWDLRHAAWALDPNWPVIVQKQEWFNVRFDHLLPSRQSQTGRAPIGRVLDYGCGCGLYATPLAERFQTYVGFDTSPAALEIARTYYRNFPDLLRRMYFNLYAGSPGDWQKGVSGEYDLVISITVLQHQPPAYRTAMVENIKTLLKPQGMYIGLEWAGYSDSYDMPPMDEDAWYRAWEPLVIRRDIPPAHPEWAIDNVWVATQA